MKKEKEIFKKLTASQITLIVRKLQQNINNLLDLDPTNIQS